MLVELLLLVLIQPILQECLNAFVLLKLTLHQEDDYVFLESTIHLKIDDPTSLTYLIKYIIVFLFSDIFYNDQ